MTAVFVASGPGISGRAQFGGEPWVCFKLWKAARENVFRMFCDSGEQCLSDYSEGRKGI